MNYSDESVPLNECILDSIMLLVRNKDYSFEIAGGIKKGDKIEDDKEKLESLGFEIDGAQLIRLAVYGRIG